MSSQTPPTYFFNGIDYNSSFYINPSSSVSQAYLSSNYLKKVGIDQSTCLTTFNSQLNMNNKLLLTGKVNQTISGNTDCIQYGDQNSIPVGQGCTGNVGIGVGTLININSPAANFNTAIGAYSGQTITSNTQNTCIGASSMNNCSSTASNNTACGVGTLRFIQYGQNCAFGVNSLSSAGQSQASSSYGFGNMNSQTTVGLADANCSFGAYGLYLNQTGGRNSGIGYRNLYNNTNSDNTGIGSQALEDNVIGNGNSALGAVAGRHNLGSNNLYLGHQSGQLSTDTTAYNYLTCLGVLSGRETGVCASNRMIFGGSSGNENYLYAGSGDFTHRDLTKTINLFSTQTGPINIGNTTSTSNITIGQFVFSWGSSIATIQNTSNTAQFQGQQTGAARFGGNQTTGTITLGCSSASTSGGSTIINSANGIITIGSTNLTTANINIGNSLTTSNITLHNGSASGTGSIVCNRAITLPTTSFSTPAATQLGYILSGNGTTGAGLLSGTPTLSVSIALPIGVWQINIRQLFRTTTASGNTTQVIGCVSATTANLTPIVDTSYTQDDNSYALVIGGEVDKNYSFCYTATAATTLFCNAQILWSTGNWRVDTKYQCMRIA